MPLWLLSLWTCVLAILASQPFDCTAATGQLLPSLFVQVSQSSDASPTNSASRALDGSNATFSLTGDQAGSFWMAKLGRPYPLETIEIVNRLAPNEKELEGLTLSLFNMDDQVVFQTGLTNPGSGGTIKISLPSGLEARSARIGLMENETNGAGKRRVGLAEVRLFGALNIPFGPEPVPSTDSVKVYQSSDYSSSFPPGNAIDGNTATFSHTANVANSYWMADLGGSAPIDRVELVNRADCCGDRMGGLTFRIFDATSNSVFSAVLPNPGLGGKWATNLPNGIAGRYFRVGSEKGQTNSAGNYYVTIAEARVFSGSTNLFTTGTASVPATNNLASLKPSYMVRLTDSIPPASNANDNDISTETKTTTQTVDGYWEVDLEGTYALFGVRTIGASGIGSRMTNATLRLFDQGHNSVFSQKLTGASGVFDSDLNGPVFARYVRVGLEDKQRTDPGGGLEWYIGMREVQVFGIPTNGVGIRTFTGSAPRVAASEPVTLSWSVDQVRRVEIHPALGSVGARTTTEGIGSISVTPTNSTEYILIASNAAGLFTAGFGVEVDSAPVSVRISEIVADNKFSLQDGYGNAPDWVELRNSGNNDVDLGGYGLSDDPRRPMKWVFPPVRIAAHTTLIVLASGLTTPFDPAGYLHASFRLDKDGGDLILTAPNGSILDALRSYPALDSDLAYGRDLEGNWTFMEPTPGAVNVAITYQGWLRPLTFDHARGFYEAPFTLAIGNSNAGASLFYSVDGTVPAIPYTTAIRLAGTKAVRAQARRSGYRPARIQTETYVFISDVITSSVMRTAITRDAAYAPRLKPGLLALPSISIVVPTKPNYEEQEGSVEVLWPNGASVAQANCGISIFGGSWQRFAKDSFSVKFRASYGTSRLHAPLFAGFDRGVPAVDSFDKLELRAGDQDMVDRGFYMSGRFMEDSMLEMGDLNPHGRFVHVYLNGVYWGQYDMREPLMEHFLSDYLGGASEDYVSVRGNDNVGDNFVVGTPDAPNVLPWERVLSLKKSYAAVHPYLDVQSLTDFMLLWFYGDCESEFRACGPLNSGTGFKFWEADADGFLRTSALGENRTGNAGPGGIFGGLVSEGNSDFKTLVADSIYKHFFNNGALTPARNDARLAARMQEIHDSLIAECARWGYRTPSNWESAAATIRSSLFPKRSAELLGMLRTRNLFPKFDPPAFNIYGGWVTNGFQPQLSSSSGNIYYTMDGSDPRLAGGGISSQARLWTNGAVSMTQDITLSVRVRTGTGQWSALAQPRYRAASELVLTARIEAGTVQMSFPAVAGETYRIEVADNADSSTWRLLREIRSAQTSMLQFSDSETGGVATTFYRVVWMR